MERARCTGAADDVPLPRRQPVEARPLRYVVGGPSGIGLTKYPWQHLGGADCRCVGTVDKRWRSYGAALLHGRPFSFLKLATRARREPHFARGVSSRMVRFGVLCAFLAATGWSAYAQTVRPGWIAVHGSACRIWDPHPVPNEMVTWSGECPNGLAAGEGVEQWSRDGVPGIQVEGVLRRGHLISGVATYPNGDRYVGAFQDGAPTGHGIYKFVNGDSYEGDFQGGNRTGRGVFTWANGDRYEGEFRDGYRWGQGVYAFADGRRQVGQWEHNSLVVLSNPAATTTHREIQLTPMNGILTAPVTIDGAVTLPFILDSGASTVLVSSTVFKQLVAAKAVTQADMRGRHPVRLADGSQVMQDVFIIRSLQVGNLTVENVVASVGPEAAPLLLGQAFLARFQSWSVNNSRQVLLLN